MNADALLEYAMNPNKSNIAYEGLILKEEVLGNKYTPYNPYEEQSEREIEANKGATVPTFLDALEYKKPQFQEQDPDAVLIALNVKEQQDEFRRQDANTQAVNALFNPVSGNTPEERAKNANINKLLAEIDNFAVQYRLTQRQIEILKTQVLGNHLGDYIRTKNSITNNDKQQQQADALALARGSNPDDGNAPIVRDPANGADENGIRNDVEATTEGGTMAFGVGTDGGADTVASGTGESAVGRPMGGSAVAGSGGGSVPPEVIGIDQPIDAETSEVKPSLLADPVDTLAVYLVQQISDPNPRWDTSDVAKLKELIQRSKGTTWQQQIQNQGTQGWLTANSKAREFAKAFRVLREIFTIDDVATSEQRRKLLPVIARAKLILPRFTR